MSRDRPRRDAIDEELARIEFPGEDEQWIRSYLDGRGFVARVMRTVAQTHIHLSRATIWGGVAALNVAILVVAGTNPFLVEDVLALKKELFTFFFAFLGITLAGCIAGVVFSVDTGRAEAFFHHIAKELSRDRLRNLFRPPR